MLDGATLLVFADDWGIHPSSAQHLFSQLLSRNRVVWFDTVGLRLPRPNWRDAGKMIRKIRRWTQIPPSPLRERGDGGEGVRPASAPTAHPHTTPPAAA